MHLSVHGIGAATSWVFGLPQDIAATSSGNVTSITLDIAKDNVQFGVRAVDQTGHRSPVAFPQVAA